jgi:hypothetical protein
MMFLSAELSARKTALHIEVQEGDDRNLRQYVPVRSPFGKKAQK